MPVCYPTLLDYIKLLTPCAGSFLKLLKKLFHYTPGQALKISRRLSIPEFLDSWLMKVVSSSALRTSCLNPTGRIPGTDFC